MATRKRGSFESNMAKFSQIGSFKWNIFLRYLSKLSDIWHFTICKIQRENCCDTPPIRSGHFLCKQLMNMHDICPNISKFLLFSTVKIAARCQSRFYIWTMVESIGAAMLQAFHTLLSAVWNQNIPGSEKVLSLNLSIKHQHQKPTRQGKAENFVGCTRRIRQL